jgi:hypothetical protein
MTDLVHDALGDTMGTMNQSERSGAMFDVTFEEKEEDSKAA